MSDTRHFPISQKAMPIVEMQIRGMGEILTQAMFVHATDIAEVAEAAVKAAIEKFDWRAEIEREVHASVKKQVERSVDSFLWSKEGKALIDGLVASAITAAFGDRKK